MLESDTTLGRYQIRSHIGSGGMGDVYLARDIRLDRNVALKILPDDVAADPERMRRFEQEARTASGLNHPNIITIYEIDRDGSRAFIATEFIDGLTLRDRMNGQPMALGDVLDVAIQVARALAAAHANRIVHRDIKPENVIVRSDGIVKVLDFGLAKVTSQASPVSVNSQALMRADLETGTGVLMGTAVYMSPEQARGQPVDARTDIFSLGVMLYELVTGRLPFGGASVYEIVSDVLSDGEAPPLSQSSTGAPAELERIVAKALRKNREERYQTSKDLLVDLQALRQGLEFEKAHATRPKLHDPGRAVTPGKRQGMPRLLGLAVLVAIAAAVIGFVWWRQARLPEQPGIRSLAVLPLKAFDAEENYLGLGIADATIRRMSQTGRLVVRPTSAVRRYLTDDSDALAAAKQLGVDAVLEGSLQRADDRLRVSVNLLRCSDGASLWTDSFEIRMADIFTMQDTVAQQVASRLRLQLDPAQQAQLTKHSTINPVAYEFYLKGLYAFDQRMRDPRERIDAAISSYSSAIESDPGFALAHAQLAYAYATRAVFLDPTNPSWVERAREEIARAEAIDPNLAETHLAKYQLLYSQFEGYQAEAAGREARRATELNPSVGHMEQAYIYNHLGLEDLAEREYARAREIDPTSDAVRDMAHLMYEVQSRYDDYAADPSLRRDSRMEALYLISKRRFSEAEAVVDRWSTQAGDQYNARPTRALILAAQGDFRRAEAEIPAILRHHPHKDPLYHHVVYDIACVYAMEGKSADAVRWLRESAASGYHLYPRYTRDAFLEPIRRSAEFVQFLAEMKAENDRYRSEFGR